jgi:hypothetical protein
MDQPQVEPASVNGKATECQTATQLDAIAGGSYTFSQTFTIVWHGELVQFRSGCAYVLDAPLLACLTGMSAPMVAS